MKPKASSAILLISLFLQTGNLSSTEQISTHSNYLLFIINYYISGSNTDEFPCSPHPLCLAGKDH